MSQDDPVNIQRFRGLGYSLTPFHTIIADPSKRVSVFDDELLLESNYARALIQEIEKLQYAVAQMITEVPKSPNLPFFMYFVNRFKQYTTRLLEYIDASGETLLKFSEIRLFLTQIQIVYNKILAIFEIFLTKTPPDITLVDRKIKPFLRHISNAVIQGLKAQDTRIREGQLDILRNDDQFQAELVNELPNFTFRFIRLAFSYYTLYYFADIDKAVKRFIELAISQIILRLTQIQSATDPARARIYLQPRQLLRYLTELLKNIEILRVAGDKLPQDLEIIPKPTEFVEFFSDQGCSACQKLFQSPLWEFLQKLAQQSNLQIQLYNISDPEDEAVCKGIYEIQRVPTLKYQTGLYWVNAAEEPGTDPHSRTFREILNFLGLLGTITYAFTSEGSRVNQENKASNVLPIITLQKKGEIAQKI